MYAGIFGFLTATFINDAALRKSVTRYCARWVIIGLAAALIGALFYYKQLPEPVQTMLLKRSPELLLYVKVFFVCSAIILPAGIFMALRAPQKVQKAVAFGILGLGLVYMGGFEFMREGGRRPFVIYGHTYANSIPVVETAAANEQGFLKSARWIKHRQIEPDNRLAAGKEIFRIQCQGCHSIGGFMNDMLPRTEKFSVFGMDSMLNGLGKINDYMPPFMGTRDERMALAQYIVSELHVHSADPAPTPALHPALEVPAFDSQKDEYVLLAWNNLGMHCISDSDAYWVLLPPANDLYAQLVRRGDRPQVVTTGIEISYKVEPGFENPSAHVEFWKYAPSLFGVELPDNVGLSGNGLSGRMHLKEEMKAFDASLIPVVPYPDSGGFNPYPLFTIEAWDKATGRLLASTKTVAPTSTEMGCRNCHGGQWRVDGKAGSTPQTAADILAVHDKNTGSRLLEAARNGQPMLCQSCHPDPVLGTKGKPGLLNFPAAMHGWHANYLTERGTEACFKCHPSSPEGPTQCLRGAHAAKSDCTTCHGTLEDHALSLLKAEDQAGKKGAQRLMRHLTPRKVASLADINPRTPWLNEPDLPQLSCGFQAPRPADCGRVQPMDRRSRSPLSQPS